MQRQQSPSHAAPQRGSCHRVGRHRPQQQPVQRLRFEVWVADTNARAEQGLMFVRDLPADRGMVFPLTPPRVETMWMKNTYIELDMLFIAADGHVVKIIARARPLSLETLSSDMPVGAVLELGDRFGISMPHTRTVYACSRLLGALR